VTLKYKTKYRARNWAAYEESLRRRGDITIWFDDDAVGSWNAVPSGRPGGQQEYSGRDDPKPVTPPSSAAWPSASTRWC